MTSTASAISQRAIELRDDFDRSFAVPFRVNETVLVDLLAIKVGEQACAVRLSEIAGLFAGKQITRLPGGDAALRGLAGFRGALLPVYDLQALLGHARAQAPRWLVIAAAAPVALAFDVFLRQLRVDPAEIVPQSARAEMPSFARELVRTNTFNGPILHLPSVLEATLATRAQRASSSRSDYHMSMFSNWTVSKRLVAGFGLSAITLILVAAVAFYNINRLIDNDVWVKHTYQVRAALSDVVEELTNAEAAMRGFVITGDENFIEPYKAALSAARPAIDELRKLTADNPNQQRRLAQLAPLLDLKYAQLKERIELRRSQGLEATIKLVSAGASKQTMEEIKALIRDADQEEVTLLTRRSEEAKAAAGTTTTITLWGGLLGTLAVTAIGFFISRSLSSQIGSAVGHVRSSSSELQAAANQQASGAKEQAAAMTEISTTISELLATSRQIAESAQRVAQNAGETANAARAGHGTVDMTHESITSIRRQVDQIVAHMLELGKKSQEIGSVLDIVSELAEQTNILAINATIEAAGAGDAGKRFAIVAEEIRKLADRVGGSTKEVRTLIDDVRSAVNTTVMATETGSKAVDAGSRQFGDVASSFKAIASLVATTTDAAREIELSTKQQSTAVEQVNIAISNVTQASMETETSATQTLQTVSQMATLSKDLMRIIQPNMAA